jgi:glycerophosphoryl diester phosphodiesterase
MTVTVPTLPARATPVVIAHRGASGYLPEHTLAAYALAMHQGADYIEPDLVMTRDGKLIARHDNVLDLTTDVAARAEFTDRRTRKMIDGRSVTGWFSEDFTLAEIKRLRVVERIPGVRPANARFDGQFEVPTLEEIIALVRAYEKALGRGIGIYPETKHPTYFRARGLPLEQTLVDLLHASGHDRACIQSFEIGNLKALRALTRLPLVQLLAPDGKPYDVESAGETLTYEKMATAEGLRDIASYADAVGPEKNMIIRLDARGDLDPAGTTDLVEHAHAAGLAVHPYTFRAENHFLPGNFRSSAEPRALGNAEAEIKAFLAAGVDGFFTDHPDAGVRAARAFAKKL